MNLVLKYIAGGVPIGSVFGLVYLGKVDPGQYILIVMGALAAIGVNIGNKQP
jgi:hypothetical protein